MIAFLVAGLALLVGNDLAGWEQQGDAGWFMEEGVVTASGDGQGFLLSTSEFGDFELQVEFWVDAGTNSGVFIRCKDRSRIYPDTCYELNIWDDHPRQEARTGAIVFKAMPPLAQVTTVDRWNRMVVLADGPLIEVRVNGELTARLDNADAQEGFIALRHWETGVVKFRNLSVRVLEK